MKKLFFVSFTVFLLVVGTISISACWIAPPSDVVRNINEYNYFVRDFNRATAVFMGEVIAIDRFRIKFKVSKVWKGDVAGEFVMSSGPVPYGNGEIILVSSCDYHFLLGEIYLVYAQRKNYAEKHFSESRYGKIPDEYKTLLWSSESGRTKLLKDAANGIENLDKLSSGQKFKLKSAEKNSRGIFKHVDNRRANF